MVIESSCCTLIDLGNGSNRQATILSSNPIHKLFYFRLHVIGVTWKLQRSSVENIKTCSSVSASDLLLS